MIRLQSLVSAGHTAKHDPRTPGRNQFYDLIDNRHGIDLLFFIDSQRTGHTSFNHCHAVLAIRAQVLRMEDVRDWCVVDQSGSHGYGGGGNDVATAVGFVADLGKSEESRE